MGSISLAVIAAVVRWIDNGKNDPLSVEPLAKL